MKSDADESGAEEYLSQLIEETLEIAELTKPSPKIVFHIKSGTVIVRATRAQHEIVAEVLEAAEKIYSIGSRQKRVSEQEWKRH